MEIKNNNINDNKNHVKNNVNNITASIIIETKHHESNSNNYSHGDTNKMYNQHVSGDYFINDDKTRSTITTPTHHQYTHHHHHHHINTDAEPEIVMSFRAGNFQSNEMKQLIQLTLPEEQIPAGLDDVTYNARTVFPEWILKNSNWRGDNAKKEIPTISEILQKDKNSRNADEVKIVVDWLMSVWKIALVMGYERCCSMLKSFEFVTYESGEDIITEGERGLTFYIVISGETAVHKKGIGIVGHLGKGKGFGEIALTQGDDLRTATVAATSHVECVRLHKSNYDYFVRDIQEQEKRENFQLLLKCPLFKTWPKGKIEKMATNCMRKVFNKGEYVFRQGDTPNQLCVILDGKIEIIREIIYSRSNRWPVGAHKWKQVNKKKRKHVLLKSLDIADFFGEVAILRDQPRTSSAIATTNKTVIICIDRLEFLHLLSYGQNHIDENFLIEEERRFNAIINKYISDQEIVNTVANVAFPGINEDQLNQPVFNKKKLKEFILVEDAYVAKESPRKGRRGTRKASTADDYNRRASRLEELNQRIEMSKQNIQQQQQQQQQLHRPASPLQQLQYNQQHQQVEDQFHIPIRKQSLAVNFHASSNLLSSMGLGGSSNSAAVGTVNGVINNINSSGGGEKGKSSSPNIKTSLRRGSTLGFQNRKGSLIGLDNDPTFIFDADELKNKVVMRQNASLQLGTLYTEVYKEMQNNIKAKVSDLMIMIDMMF